MFCPNCGSNLEEDSLFCVVCGARLADFEEAGYEIPGRDGQPPFTEEPGYDHDYGRRPAGRPLRPENHTLRNGIIAAVIIVAAGIGAFFGIRHFMGGGNDGTTQSADAGSMNNGQNDTQNSGTNGAQNDGSGSGTVLTPDNSNAPVVTAAPSVTTPAAPTQTPAVTLTPSATAAPTATPTPSAQPTPVVTSQPTPTVTSQPTPTVTSQPTPTARPTQAPSSGRSIYVLKPTEGLNVRDVSDYNSNCLFTVYGSTPMVFNGKVETGYGSDGAIHDWYQVEISNVRGWVRSDLVQSSRDGYFIKNTDGAMNMRTDHRYSSDLAATVFYNTRLRFTGETGTGYGSDGQMHDWMLMETAQTITGWVRADLTTG